MRILLTGATGFIGRALMATLQRQGHTVVALVRSEARARSSLGADVELLASTVADDVLTEEVGRADAIINLAGEPIAGRRWTTARRRAIVDSRMGVTTRLVQAIAQAARKPGVFISSSAVGVYGDRGDERLDETSAPGSGFLSALAVQWETAALAARRAGVRVVVLRIGIVIGREGGMIGSLQPVFALGLGGPIGCGQQFTSWIGLTDLIRVITQALVDDRYEGAINAVSPEPVTNRQLTRALGVALGRPAVLPVPAAALRAIFGESADVLIASHRVRPVRLQQLGFSWRYSGIEQALRAAVDTTRVRIRPAREQPTPTGPRDRKYLEAHPATYLLQAKTVIDAPVDDAFAFFSSAANLGLLTPPGMRFQIVRAPAEMQDGVQIDYKIRVGPFPISWRTRITKWEPGRRFVDIQERGPYRCWWHEHVFRADEGRTIMEDYVWYTPPLGVLGRLANRLMIGPMLARIFSYRADAIAFRYGGDCRIQRPLSAWRLPL